MGWLTRLGRRLQRRPLLIDVMLVAGLSTVAVVEALQFQDSAFRPADARSAALTALAVTPMLLRAHRPELSLGAVLASGVALGIGGYYTGNFLMFGMLIALYSVAVQSNHRRSLIALGCAVLWQVAIVVMVSRRLDEPTLVTDLVLVMISATVWGMGVAHRRLRENAWTLAALTHQLRDEQAASERRAVLEERHRIARELHDVVAHHISAIAMQANAARATPSTDRGTADQNLALISAASRDALTEMRRLIGILKDAEVADPRLPLPTLADLPKLVARANEASLTAELEIRGVPRPLPRMLELSAYRIVQEALTNSIRHAGPASARVLVHYKADRLDLAVADTGGGPQVPSHDVGGHGLVGMRERVALFGGVLYAGPGPDGGFLVTATLPVLGSAP